MIQSDLEFLEANGKNLFKTAALVSKLNGDSFEFPVIVDGQNQWFISGTNQGYPG